MADIFDQIHAQQPPVAGGGGRGGGAAPPAPGGGRGGVAPAGGDIFDQIHTQQPQQPQQPQVPRPNVSFGASDEDIIRSFGYKPEDVAKSPIYQQMKKSGGRLGGMLTDPASTNESWSDATTHGNLTRRLSNSWVGDVGQGAMSLFKGTAQLAQHGLAKVGLADERDSPFFDLLSKLQEQDYEQNIRHGNAHPLVRLAGNLVAGAMLPGMEPAAEAGLGRRVAAGAVNGAIAGATQPVDVPGSGDFWKTKAEQAATGAATGAAVTGVVGGVARGAAKLITKARNARAVQLPSEVAADVDRANTRAEQTFGAANSVAEQRGAKAIENAEQGAAESQAAAQTGARQTVDNLRGGMAETPREIGDLSEAAASGDRHAAMVLDKVQQAGDDPARLYESGIGLQSWRATQAASQKYGQVEGLTQTHDLGPMPLAGTGRVLGGAEGRAKIGMRDKGLDRTLADIRDALTPQPEASANTAAADPVRAQQAEWGIKPPAGRLVDAAGKPLAPSASPAKMQASYGAARKVISQLDEIIRTGRTGDNALVTDRGIGELQQIKNSLENDTAQYVQNSGVPELQRAQKDADEFYRQAVVPFKDVTVAKSGSTNEPDTIFKKFVMAGRGDRAQKFYNALDAKGQSAVQYEIVSDAFNKATDQATGNFSPKAFFNALDKVQEAHGVFFQGRDKLTIEGLKNLMTTAIDRDAQVAGVKDYVKADIARTADVGKANIAATKEAGAQRLADITARVRNLDKYPLGTAAAASAAGAEAFGRLQMPVPSALSGSVFAITGSMKALMMTDAGRRFLLASSFLRPGTKALVGRIDNLAAGKLSARAATSDRTQ